MPDVPVGLVGVVGRPIDHSLSPLLHTAAFEALSVPWTSLAFEVGPGGGASVVEAMRTLGLKGLSVTMPLKEEVALAVDRLEGPAAHLRSVNCLVRDGDEIVGLSTDGDGLLAALDCSFGFTPASSRVVIVGGGGAARSVAAALGAAGALEVAVVTRTETQAAQVAVVAGACGRVGDPTDAALADLVIETTPVGMAGTAAGDAVPLVDPGLLHAGQIAVDLVYQPRRTAWVEHASAQGATTMGGLGMLVHQAALQITRWTGREAPVEAMWAAVEARGDTD